MDNMKQDIAFLAMIEDDFREARDFIISLLANHPDGPDYREASTEHRALDLSTVTTYGRIFKISRGFGDPQPHIDAILGTYSTSQRTLHGQVLTARDKEYAHSDADANKIEVYPDGPFRLSRKVIREPLSHAQLRMLQEMVVQGMDTIGRRRESLERRLRAAT